MKPAKQVFWESVQLKLGNQKRVVPLSTQASFGSPFNRTQQAPVKTAVTPAPMFPSYAMDYGERIPYEANLVAAVDAAKERMNNGTGTMADLQAAEDALRVYRAIRGAGGNRNVVYTSDIKQAQDKADSNGRGAEFAKNDPNLKHRYWSLMKSKQNAELLRSALQRVKDKQDRERKARLGIGHSGTYSVTPISDTSSSSSSSTSSDNRYGRNTYGNVRVPKDRTPGTFYKASAVAGVMKKSAKVQHREKSVSGRKVIYTNGHSVIPFLNYTKMETDELTHALLIRNTIFVAKAHADAMAQAIRTFGGKTPDSKEAFINRIDNDEEPIEYGYYYDNDFHIEPKHMGMVY